MIWAKTDDFAKVTISISQFSHMQSYNIMQQLLQRYSNSGLPS